METKKKDDRKLLGSQIEDRILEYIRETVGGGRPASERV